MVEYRKNTKTIGRRSNHFSFHFHIILLFSFFVFFPNYFSFSFSLKSRQKFENDRRKSKTIISVFIRSIQRIKILENSMSCRAIVWNFVALSKGRRSSDDDSACVVLQLQCIFIMRSNFAVRSSHHPPPRDTQACTIPQTVGFCWF